ADIAPIVIEHCASCHRPDGGAPFSLLSYEDVRRRATQIAMVTERRLMPPWKPEPGYGVFDGERRLSETEIALILQWVKEGALEGDSTRRPIPPDWKGGWQLGQPDLIATMPQPYFLTADGPDVFRTVVIPVPGSRHRFVEGLEFLPGNSKVIHHANIKVARS